jgi:formylglycine-generating enzyme required for sulfatase activity
MFARLVRIVGAVVTVLLVRMPHAQEMSRHDPALSTSPGSGQTFRDYLANGQLCTICPEMVVVPAGTFVMGSPESEEGRGDNEGPHNEIIFAVPFAVGRFAVTFHEWDACFADGGCNGYRPYDISQIRGNLPVIDVNRSDAKAYAAWLSKRTGKSYRLLAEAEREYVTRAGTTTPFWFIDLQRPCQLQCRFWSCRFCACAENRTGRHLRTQSLGPLPSAWQHLGVDRGLLEHYLMVWHFPQLFQWFDL